MGCAIFHLYTVSDYPTAQSSNTVAQQHPPGTYLHIIDDSDEDTVYQGRTRQQLSDNTGSDSHLR